MRRPYWDRDYYGDRDAFDRFDYRPRYSDYYDQDYEIYRDCQRRCRSQKADRRRYPDLESDCQRQEGNRAYTHCDKCDDCEWRCLTNADRQRCPDSEFNCQKRTCPDSDSADSTNEKDKNQKKSGDDRKKSTKEQGKKSSHTAQEQETKEQKDSSAK